MPIAAPVLVDAGVAVDARTRLKPTAVVLVFAAAGGGGGRMVGLGGSGDPFVEARPKAYISVDHNFSKSRISEPSTAHSGPPAQRSSYLVRGASLLGNAEAASCSAVQTDRRADHAIGQS